MSCIYILSDYGKLGKKDETIIFSQKDGTSTILFPYKTEHLVLIGKVSISADAFRLLTKYKIPVTFLSSNGKFTGKLTFGDSKNIFLRQKQFRILDDKEQLLKIAKSIVTGKIKNQISFMQRIKRKNSVVDKKVSDAINAIKNTLANAEKTDDIEKLRGFEGLAARQYFSVFEYNITPEWAEFKSRSKNPPKSNVNAVLSFLYTLLMYRVESALESQGLDICVGNLHAINYGKNALVFDLMEEFRTPICDSICSSLFNLGTLEEEDFEKVIFSKESDDYPLQDDKIPEGNETSQSEEGLESGKESFGILLTKKGIKKVIAAFEAKMDNLIMYPPTGEKLSYIKIIYQQVIHYKRVISGEETEYKSYYFK